MESLGESRKRNEEKEEEPVKLDKRRRRSGGDALECLVTVINSDCRGFNVFIMF